MSPIPPPPPILDLLELEAEVRRLSGRRIVYTETHLQLVDETTDEITPIRREGRSIGAVLRWLRDRLAGIAAGEAEA